MNFLSAAWLVLLKDLRAELRTREIVLTTVLFAVLVVLLAAFAFGLGTVPAGAAAGGVLWIAVAFAGILALGRTFLREREFGVWTAMLMSPAPRSALYLGKVLGVTLFLLLAEMVLVPVIDLLFHAPLLSNFWPLLPILVLGTIGYAATGCLFAAMTIRTRLRDLLLGVILFPLVSPVLIFSIKGTRAVLDGGGMAALAEWLPFIAIFDAIFLVGGLWLFGVLMED
ncbi:MAG: heme exporter protein CcmB [Deltaproteobacteria bacterium]|nr:heme exporter protein CcmB [Deltaproteobacteria bacterium]